MRTLVVTFLTISTAAYAADPSKLDPRARDEDISGAEVTVDIGRTPEGLYEYTYSYSASATNKGTISSFLLDIGCSAQLDRSGLPIQPDTPGLLPSRSTDNKHSPVNVSADFGATSTFAINAANQVRWSSDVAPGESVSGLRLLSTMPPKARQYSLIPSMDNDLRWDYASFEEDDPTVPWIPDFTVNGQIQGPACVGDVIDPPPPPPSGVFPGTPKPQESAEINSLLSYSEPTSDRFHVSAGAGQQPLIIHYSERIDPKSFRVEPADGQLRKLFNPTRGGSETVHLPLNAMKNKFILSVRRERPRSGEASDTAHGPGPDKDIDVFEIRLEQPAVIPGPTPGKKDK